MWHDFADNLPLLRHQIALGGRPRDAHRPPGGQPRDRSPRTSASQSVDPTTPAGERLISLLLLIDGSLALIELHDRQGLDVDEPLDRSLWATQALIDATRRRPGPTHRPREEPHMPVASAPTDRRSRRPARAGGGDSPTTSPGPDRRVPAHLRRDLPARERHVHGALRRARPDARRRVRPRPPLHRPGAARRATRAPVDTADGARVAAVAAAPGVPPPQPSGPTDPRGTAVAAGGRAVVRRRARAVVRAQPRGRGGRSGHARRRRTWPTTSTPAASSSPPGTGATSSCTATTCCRSAC